MSHIQVKLLGGFAVTLNGKSISFPYNKVQALFCYLLMKKQATRDELSGLLWTDMEENIARKNLRNAIYKLKKSFGDEEVLEFLNKSTIALNTNIDIEVDVDKFIENESETNLYTGEFLKGYMPKDAESFESWMIETREYLEELYTKKLNKQIECEKANKNYDKVEQYCKLLVKIDEFNEEAYRILINSYREQGKFNNAIRAYNKISDTLMKELATSPDEKTTKAFKEILDLMNNKNNEEKYEDYFYGRINELRIIKNNYINFINDKTSKSVLIKGEMGIGKTSLKDRFLKFVEKENVYIFETNCYQFENEYTLKPWRNIISDLTSVINSDKIKMPVLLENIINDLTPESNYDNHSENLKLDTAVELMKYDVIGNVISNVFKRISMNKKILIIFEDIQWMDSASISLLASFVSHFEENNIMFLLTCRNEFTHDIDRFFTSINQCGRVQIIELMRFNAEEVEGFINNALPKYNLSKEITRKIYTETEGNTFFLTEYLNTIKAKRNINIMTSKMQDVLKSRFVDISKDEKKIIEIASLFDDEVSMFILRELTQKDELEIMDIIEQLENKYILKEITKENTICFKFTHQKLREFQYINLTQAKRRILHNKVGKLLEQTLRNNIKDFNIYYKLVYHFQNASNHIETLKYKIKSLNVHLNFNHELFPIIPHDDRSYNKVYFSESKTVKNIKEIEQLLNKVKDEEGDLTEVLRFDVCVLHIKGRYLIRKGKYDEGIKNIEHMIDKAKEINFNEYTIEGYKQMIYYCIQTNKTEKMIEYINWGLSLAQKCDYHNEIGILLRLKALYNKMIGEYEEAEKLIQESINTLSSTKNISDQYALNIAACYNYIGDIRKKNSKFSEALQYYNKAIELCDEKNVLTSVALFQTNAGETSYYMGNCNLAKGYFQNALNIYRQFDSIWGKAIAEAFMALIAISEENYDGALKYLKNADENSKALKNPKEIGTVFRVKTEIKISMEDNIYIKRTFENYLNESLEEYVKQGIKYLKEVKDQHQIDVMYKLINNEDVAFTSNYTRK